jgi:hypothetical protein
MNRTTKREVVVALIKAGRRDLARDFVRAAEGGFSLNMANTPLGKAHAYTAAVMMKAGKDIDEELPDFDRNYMMVQKALKKAKDIPRILMPVIEPHNMKDFHKSLKEGRIDIFKPWAKGKLYTPTNLKPGKGGEEFSRLGFEDGDSKDDVVGAKWTSIPAKKLLPTQSQIWLEKVAGNIANFGTPKQGSSVTDQTIIVSQEGYILDGHHRYGQAMIANPNLKLKALFIPVGIDLLVKVARSYGNSIGNEQKG